jgi:hypothetical protein
MMMMMMMKEIDIEGIQFKPTTKQQREIRNPQEEFWI